MKGWSGLTLLVSNTMNLLGMANGFVEVQFSVSEVSTCHLQGLCRGGGAREGGAREGGGCNISGQSTGCQ